MIQARILSAMVVFAVAVLLAGCWSFGGATPAQSPTATATASVTLIPAQRATALATATDIPARETVEVVTVTAATLAVEITATITPTETPTATLTVLYPVNIRSGPGITYPAVGTFAEGATTTILATTADRAWWKVVCPSELEDTECWVVADEQYAAAQAAVIVPVTATPTMPPPTPPPTATPCIVSMPPGWTAYTVQPGDTLSTLAARSGTSVSALVAANCLASDLITAGSSLNLPAAGDGRGFAGSVPPTAVAEPRSTTGVSADLFSAAIPATLGTSFPNRGCPEIANFAVHIPDPQAMPWEAGQQKLHWELGQIMWICFYGFDMEQPITLQITGPNGFELAFPIPAPDDPAFTFNSYAWRLRADLRPGHYTINAGQPDNEADPLSVWIEPASEPRLLVLSPIVTLGDDVYVSLSGYPAEPALILYEESNQIWNKLRYLQRLDLNAEGNVVGTQKLIGVVPDRDYTIFDGIVRDEGNPISNPNAEFRVVRPREEEP